MDKEDSKTLVVGIALLVASVLGLVIVAMFVLPHYSVWQQGLAGEAELRRAEQNRKILVQEAEAKAEASKMLAQADIERARGTAEANKIIAEGLGGPSGYLRWLWVEALKEGKNQVIYVPTETGIPLMEAGKR